VKQDRNKDGADADKPEVLGFFGTMVYTAPEVIAGNAYNTKADIYSFSMVVWEMLMRRTPYMSEYENDPELDTYAQLKGASR
jgi:serine/threonine protein kinase